MNQNNLNVWVNRNEQPDPQATNTLVVEKCEVILIEDNITECSNVINATHSQSNQTNLDNSERENSEIDVKMEPIRDA